MDPKKIFDPGEMPMPLIDEAGDKLGHKLVDFLDFLAKRLGLAGVAEMPDEVKAIAPTLIKLAGGGLTVRRDHVPIKGTLGDLVTKYLNTFVDSSSRGVAKGVKEAAARDTAAEAKADKAAASDALLDRLGFVNKGIWYPSDCTHGDRPYVPKGGKRPDDIPLREAMKRNHDVCRNGCLGAPAEVDLLLAAKGASAEAKEPEKKEHKTMSTETPSKPATPAKTLGQLKAEFRAKDPVGAETLEKLLDVFGPKDPALLEKFREVAPFMTVENLQAFAYAEPSRWHRMLDDLRGGANPVKDGFIRTAAKLFGRAAGDVREGVATGMSEESDEFGGMLDGLKETAEAGAMKLRGLKTDLVGELRNIGAEDAPETERPKQPFPYVTFFCAIAFIATAVFAILHH